MAIRITINVSKKIPIPGQDFSSQTASCSIEAEATGDPVADAQDLYRQAESAVNQQLGLSSTVEPLTAHSGPSYPNARPTRPYNGRSRRGPPPATTNQVRLLERLLRDQPVEPDQLNQSYGVSDIRQLTVKDASHLIDQLKLNGVSR